MKSKLLAGLLLGATVFFNTVIADDLGQAKADLVPKVTFNNGVQMPQLGLGTFLLAEKTDDQEAYNAVLTAIKNGYRHIDTAHAYGNERSVGKAVRDSGIKRSDIWITSKLWVNEVGKGKTKEALDRMFKRFGFDYLDLVYLHQPFGDVYGGWEELVQAQKEGKVKAIGISNFDKDEALFDEFVQKVSVKPQVMQLECHPYAQRVHWQEKLKANNIAQEDWYPLGSRQSNGLLLKDPVLTEIAKAHNKSVAQVILRWHIQIGSSVIPGASNPDYIKENIAIFDFSLTDEEMQKIGKLNTEKRIYDVPVETQRTSYSKTILID